MTGTSRTRPAESVFGYDRNWSKFARLADSLDPRGDPRAPPSLALREGVGHATIGDRVRVLGARTHIA